MPITLRKTKVFDSLVLTPFIDIMMFLVLALLLAADLNSTPQKELPIKLPSVQGAMPLTVEPDSILVGILSDGNYVVDGVTMTKGAVEEFIARSAVDNPINQRIEIRADRDVKYKYVATIIDICNRSKVASYRVLVDNEDAPTP
ncbi:MAG: biopolymer transporter ExbD [Pirellula sp.]